MESKSQATRSILSARSDIEPIYIPEQIESDTVYRIQGIREW